MDLDLHLGLGFEMGFEMISWNGGMVGWWNGGIVG